ncbi:hypothetical protein BOSE62_70761 [Bosea sp. 62]|nr:hypothetical protein BOSE7B_50603 [Bosea sp. 7B]CAD5298781.1 hypothetical protein BOSE21B_90891 [Bosea sp. 21B]CAD5298935.1 hypothetical protein BOSE46_80964 [Bosea sp. 46]VVT61537.1 hypothetical protein BOS5A_230814 [Bosea sp. EC-HK365B]VXB11188.1 hypothetical protein BOSE127_100273 [Bosea sp. 127]VXB32357.1 hypothetical protein BOSE125_130487 [Bosea sp. 125]VXC81048.1 hypothetical protein BOSE62_70761 [Bosea sp. 62]VXC85652.1 hypothetical protein BOSE29B_80849 [Bosea sp. 29B]
MRASPPRIQPRRLEVYIPITLRHKHEVDYPDRLLTFLGRSRPGSQVTNSQKKKPPGNPAASLHGR